MLTDNFINTVKSKVNIIDIIDLFLYDQDFDSLKDRISKTKKESFDPNDFYLISHYDPEYYLPHCPYGLTTFNLVRTFQELDISLSRLIIVTNCTGHLNQFKYLIPIELHKFELPIVIDDCLTAFSSNFLDNFNYTNLDINAKKIKVNAISMMRVPRLHRNALYNHIVKENLLHKIAISYKNES